VSYRIDVRPVARKALRNLPRPVVERIDVAILELAETPRPPGCTKLTNQEAWRIRVGNYRIIYEINDGLLVVTVIEVGHRREVYR